MKRIGISLIIFLVILGGIFLFWDKITNLYFQLFLNLPQIEKQLTSLMEKTQKQIVTPPPLRATEETLESFLTKDGVIAFTNSQREKAGLSAFRENAKLDQSAELKVEDMLKNQYFAHNSPSGAAVGDLADKVGYEFIAIGENLALGNFENDKALVQAWMDSPGHKANILNSRYQDIGVAVLKGTFEGKTTWLAVQHFGLSLSACPQPDEAAKQTIMVSQDKLNEIFKQLKTLESEIKNTVPNSLSEYQEKINQYNELVVKYNLLVEQTKTIINQYDNQVKLFNECVLGTK